MNKSNSFKNLFKTKLDVIFLYICDKFNFYYYVQPS